MNKYYNVFAGNQCCPKCTFPKAKNCRSKIADLLEKTKISSYKEFLQLVRKKVCHLSPAEYSRNVYKEPVCTCSSEHKIKQKPIKLQEFLEEVTLLLLWLNRFSDQKFQGQSIWRSWKGYDWDILNLLLKKGYISFSYKSKSILFRDEGEQKAKTLLKKYHLKND